MEEIKSLNFPKEVKVEAGKSNVKVTGPKGTIAKEFKTKTIEFELKGNTLTVKTKEKNRRKKSAAYSVSSIIRNMIDGVTKGFESEMAIIYSHFPMNISVSKQNKKLIEIVNYLGGKKILKAKIIGEKTEVKIEGKNIKITGIDKEEVGQTAANIEKAVKVLNKDRRVFQDGIYITGKARVVA